MEVLRNKSKLYFNFIQHFCSEISIQLPFNQSTSQLKRPLQYSIVFVFLFLHSLVFCQIEAGPNDTINPGVPVTLTSSFGVNSIGVMLSDDEIAGPFPIGFSFRFFGVNHQEFYIGANGWISFSHNIYWNTRDAFIVPSAADYNPKDCILGPMQDFDPEITGGPYVYYQTLGRQPNRKLVVMWCQCPMYVCKDTLTTFQIVLNEGQNTIENQIYHKPFCSNHDNKATLGVQNTLGDVGFTVPGRNATSWVAWQEGWRYTPKSTDSFEISSIPFHFQAIVPGDKISYSWYAGSEEFASTQSVTVTPNETTLFHAYVTVCSGQRYTDSLTIYVIPYIPNAFTPNGDGRNDIFNITGIPVDNIIHYRFQIFNRFGQMMFATSDVSIGWDGKLNGELCPEGVYIWSITYESADKKQITNKGIITLLR